MKKSTIWLLLVAVMILGLVMWGRGEGIFRGNSTNNNASTTEAFDKSFSDGLIKVVYTSEDFGLASSSEQILVKSFVPPCDPLLDYCLYYIGNAFEGTNFESAGLRIKKRTELKTENTCINTPPVGYSNSVLPNTKFPREAYTTAIFEGMGKAATGHVSNGSVYRLFHKKNFSCYELESRVAYSQFSNFKEGSIDEFSEESREMMKVRLINIIKNISLTTGEIDIFP